MSELPTAPPATNLSGSTVQTVDAGDMLIHARRTGGVSFKPPTGERSGASYVGTQDDLQAQIVAVDDDAPSFGLHGSDSSRLGPRGGLGLTASANESVIKLTGRARFDRAHVEIKAPGGAFWRMQVGDDGVLRTTRAPALAAPGRSPPATLANFAVAPRAAACNDAFPTLTLGS